MSQQLPKTIRQLLIVLLTALLGAIGLTALMVTYYSPSGHYSAGNMLFSLKTIDQLRLLKDSNFYFNRVVLVYWNESTHQRQQKVLSHSDYNQIYQTIANDENLQEPPPKIVEAFQSAKITALNTYVIDNHSQNAETLFSVVEFLPAGDYYRIRIIDTTIGWVYFHHSEIGPKIKEIYL